MTKLLKIKKYSQLHIIVHIKKIKMWSYIKATMLMITLSPEYHIGINMAYLHFYVKNQE